MKKKMMSVGLFLLGIYVTCIAASQGSCVGRCGEVFARGRQCSCDYNCLQHSECCPDYAATCISGRSCQGRCGEAFKRGQPCECDPLCVLYNTCCPDYRSRCDVTQTASNHGNIAPAKSKPSWNRKPERNQRKSNSDSEETHIARGRCPPYHGVQCQGTPRLPNPAAPSSPGSAPPAVPTNHLPHGNGNVPSSQQRRPIPSPPNGAQQFQQSDLFLPKPNSLTLGNNAPQRPPTFGAIAGKLNVHLVLSSGRGPVSPSGPNQGVNVPAGTKPSILQDVAQTGERPVGEAGLTPAGTSPPAADLCSDLPINALTALLNGTVLIFQGELFWSIDPVTNSVGPPENITDALGITAPIDTIFTRANCEGNIYIIKGDQCWLLDGNMVLQPGFPKPVASEFPGLTGSINAALAVPATRKRPEMVYFFKKGDIMQKFTFPADSVPPCQQKPKASFKNAPVEIFLSGDINIKLSQKDFPTPVTSALSVPSPQEVESYQHYVFSGPLYFRVEVSGDLPTLAESDPSTASSPLPILRPPAVVASPGSTAGTNPSPTHPPNSIKFLLSCP